MITTYDVHDIFAQLPSGIFSIPGWFISGGSAVYHNATDIDIYFTTEASFNAVNKLCISTCKHSHTTDNAITYTTKPNPFGSVRSKPIQLVKRQFVPIPLMLADFDLNVCRKAILPNGRIFALPESNHPLQLDLANLRSNSAQRFIRYIERGFITHTLRFEELIHHLIANLDVELPGYYDNHTCTCYNALNRLYSHPSISPVITCIIDSYPPSTRTDLYSRLIGTSGCYMPDPSFSEEHQLATSTCNLLYATTTIQINYPELFI